MPIVPSLLALSLALAPMTPGFVEDDPPEASVDAGLKKIAEGDKFADEGKTTEAEVAYQEAMERLLPGLRHLPFKHSVKRDVTRRSEIAEYLLKEIEEDQTPAEFRAEELALKAFGLLPPDLDYRKTIVQVYTEEIGAFYDPETDTMHLILEEGPGRQPGLLERLLGRKPGFNKDESKTVIAHELTHALADQHYDLDVLMKAIEHDDDRELALAALIEGEATFVMMGAQSEDWTGEKTAELPADALGSTFSLMMPLLTFASGQALRDAPKIIGESMLFPYLRGLVFCASLTNADGWKAIDGAYADPPLSTEQILHPEKYRDDLDTPQAIDLGDLGLGADWTELTRNVMGEFQISVLLRKQGGKSAAAGWDGDTFAIFEGHEGKVGLAWATTWDTPADAEEFARAFARYRGAEVDEPALDLADATIERKGRKPTRLRLKGQDVLIVEGLEAGSAAAILDTLVGAKKSDKGR